MIICCGPFCVPCWPIFFLIMRPIWDLLPESWRTSLTKFWDSKVYPNVVHPVLSRMPEKMQKFITFGMKRAIKVSDRVSKNPSTMTSCCDDKACGDRGKGELHTNSATTAATGTATGGTSGTSTEDTEMVSKVDHEGVPRPSDDDSTTCEERADNGSGIRQRRGSGIITAGATGFPDEKIIDVDGVEKLAEVLSLARSGGPSPLPIFLDFTASWCKPCQKIKPVYEELAEKYGPGNSGSTSSSSNQPKALFCTVDADEFEDLHEAFSVVSLPTVIRVDVGKVVGGGGDLLDGVGRGEAGRLKLVTEGSLREFVEKGV